VADHQVLTSLVLPGMPTGTTPARTDGAIHTPVDRGKEITETGGRSCPPGVRTGRSDTAQDPNGYRTLMVTQLAERHYRQPGLAGRLLAAMPPKYVRPKEADLVALVQAGELDYAWSYRNIAVTTGLPSVVLPAEVDLSDPRLEAAYRQATV
jgi:molybdate/tungstate transport system substrate-binding protein